MSSTPNCSISCCKTRNSAVIQDTGGLRKIRWKVAGRGKSGGVRVIYFHVNAAAQFRMLLIYRKGVKDDLNAKEKAALRSIKARWG
jgi:hypothetical protein